MTMLPADTVESLRQRQRARGARANTRQSEARHKTDAYLDAAFRQAAGVEEPSSGPVSDAYGYAVLTLLTVALLVAAWVLP